MVAYVRQTAKPACFRVRDLKAGRFCPRCQAQHLPSELNPNTCVACGAVIVPDDLFPEAEESPDLPGEALPDAEVCPNCGAASVFSGKCDSCHCIMDLEALPR